FYDAPTPPAGVFDDFLAIPSTQRAVYTRSFSDLILSLGSLGLPDSLRLVVRCIVWWKTADTVTSSFVSSGVPVTQYSPAVLDAFVNQATVSSFLTSGYFARSRNTESTLQLWGARLAALDKTAESQR
ncbi:hypothetical protein BC826DRAFT_919589, partial [Russula brevipes]